MKSQKRVFGPLKFILRIVGILFLLLVGFCVLASYNKNFQFNLINEGSSDYSQTKEEAIHRKTFVCDIEPSSNPYKISNSHVLYFSSGWVEQPWRDGFWYWTTKKDANSGYYNIILIYRKNKRDTTDWRIINKPLPGSTGYVQLQDFKGRLTGTIDSLPISDTLRYTVLKRDTIDFRPNNIEGVLILVLHPDRHYPK